MAVPVGHSKEKDPRVFSNRLGQRIEPSCRQARSQRAAC